MPRSVHHHHDDNKTTQIVWMNVTYACQHRLHYVLVMPVLAVQVRLISVAWWMSLHCTRLATTLDQNLTDPCFLIQPHIHACKTPNIFVSGLPNIVPTLPFPIGDHLESATDSFVFRTDLGRAVASN